MGKPYIPTKEADMVVWAVQLLTLAKTHKGEWKLDDNQLDSLLALANEVKTLHEKCLGKGHTGDDMDLKHKQKEILIKRLEKFIQNNIYHSDYVDEEGIASLGLPLHDTIKTPQEPPDVEPQIEIETPHARALKIKFRDPTSKRWGKHPNANGIECRWVFAETPPKNSSELIHSEFATASPMEMLFEEDQRGKRVYFACRWQGSEAKKGPFTDIFSAVVP